MLKSNPSVLFTFRRFFHLNIGGFFKAIEHYAVVGIHFRNNTPLTTLTKVWGECPCILCIPPGYGTDVGDEPDRKIASKLGHLLISKKILEKHAIKIF